MDRSRRKGGSNEPGAPLRCAESVAEIRRHCLNGEKETHSSVGTGGWLLISQWLSRRWPLASACQTAQVGLCNSREAANCCGSMILASGIVVMAPYRLHRVSGKTTAPAFRYRGAVAIIACLLLAVIVHL